jgi:3-hydroxyisobutyrate dehydrogenase
MSRILSKGYSVTVTIGPKRRQKNLLQKAKVAILQTLAAESDVIISMISDDPVLEEVSLERMAFEGAKSGTIYIDMSTVSPVSSTKVAEVATKKGLNTWRHRYQEYSVGHIRTLTIFASGPKDAYDKCTEIFGAMGQKVFHVGNGDEARYLKLLLNMMVGITSAMAGEALIFGEKGGMDWSQMIDIIGASVVASPLIGYKAQMLKSRNFAPAFTIDQIAKDFDIALETGRAANVPMPITALARQFFGAMKAKGKGNLDFFGLVTYWRACWNQALTRYSVKDFCHLQTLEITSASPPSVGRGI